MRRGWLRNGNPPGDFSTAPRCGAKTRRGTSCECPAMRNGRCRLHGGLSTGPKTAEGIERIRRAVTKHGRYSKTAKKEQHTIQTLMRDVRSFLKELAAVSARFNAASTGPEDGCADSEKHRRKEASS